MSIDINNLVAGGRVNSSISVARDGYTALGVVGVNPNVWGVTAEGLSISDGKTLRYRFHNGRSSSTSLTIWVYILYKKND